MKNVAANKAIKQVLLKNKNIPYNAVNNNKIIQNVFDIYNDIEEEKAHFVINSILKTCIQFKQPVRTMDTTQFWNDVNHIISTPDNNRNKGSISFPLLLKYCIKTNDFDKGTEFINNADLISKTDNIFIQTALIDFYGHFKDIDNAKNVFDSICNSKKDYVCIGSMMKVLTDNNYNEDALILYDKFDDIINDVCYVLSIKACINTNNYLKGKQIHSKLLQNPQYLSLEVMNALMDFYGHFGDVESALNIFNTIDDKKKDVVTISIMMKCYVNNQQYDGALDLFDNFNNKFPSDISNVFAIKACTATDNYKKGKYIHTNIISQKKYQPPQLNTSLIDFYLYFGDISTAKYIFNSIHNNDKTMTMIRCLIKGLINNQLNEDALYIYDQHKLLTNHRTHGLALKACININNFDKGMNIINTYNLLSNTNQSDVIIQTVLIEFYGHFNDLLKAKSIFESINDEQLDIVSINSMMAIYVDNDHNKDALNLFNKYQNKYNFNDITYILAIKSCTNIGDFDKGKEICSMIENDNSLQQIVELKNTLIHFYGTFGDIDKAINIFNSINNDKKDIFSIGAMMEAYYNNKYFSECLELFKNMKSLNHNICEPNIVCYCIALKACTQSTSYHFGEEIYKSFKNKKEMLNDVQIQINLINFHGKCGKLNICKEIFKKSKNKQSDIGIWSALINAYSRNGKIKKIKKLYDKIQEMDVFYKSMDRKFFITLINACSHCGDIEYGNKIWCNDINNDNIKFDSYLVTSLVDCFARKGLIEKAQNIINQYEEYKKINNIGDDNNDKAMWMSLLNGCKNDGNIELGQQIYNEINNKFVGNMSEGYISSIKLLLSNIHALSERNQMNE